MADTFYDKTLYKVVTTVTTDSDGFARIAEPTTGDSFKGNVHYDRLDAIQQDYGIAEEVVATVTTDEDIEANSIILYEDRYFRVERSLKRDSHNLLILVRWLLAQQSSA